MWQKITQSVLSHRKQMTEPQWQQLERELAASLKPLFRERSEDEKRTNILSMARKLGFETTDFDLAMSFLNQRYKGLKG